jgi:drug/metabolite transporter (DMT)-like permease
VRACIGLTAMVCMFTAYDLLPLPDATAINFATPLIVVVLAFFMLGETVRIYRWSAVAVGFVGILVVLSPHLGEGDFDNSATFGAIARIYGRSFCSPCHDHGPEAVCH